MADTQSQLYGYDNDYLPTPEAYPDPSALPPPGRGLQGALIGALQLFNKTYQDVNQIENLREADQDIPSDYSALIYDATIALGATSGALLSTTPFGARAESFFYQLAQPLAQRLPDVVANHWLPIYSVINLLPDVLVASNISFGYPAIQYNPDVRPSGFFDTDEYHQAVAASDNPNNFLEDLARSGVLDAIASVATGVLGSLTNTTSQPTAATPTGGTELALAAQ